MHRKKIIWISLGAAAVILRLVLSPEAIEKLYSRGLFLGIRWSIDTFFAWLPAPLMYLLLPILFFMLGRNAWRWFKTRESWKNKIIQASMSTLAFIGATVFLFLFLWGFNYGRVPMEMQLGLEPKPLTLDELKEELRLETQILVDLRKQIPGITDFAFTSDLLPPHLENEIRGVLTSRLQQYHYPTVGRVRGRLLYPKGIFLRFSSAGLYFPWTGEGHIDAGLHALQIPYVMAHEMAHGYGFGDEGDCSFWAYLACANSENPAIAYAGHLDYWRSLAADFARYDREGFRALRKSLPIGIQADLRVIYETLEKYPDLMPRLRYAAYDAYLRTQGIEEGMLNYDRVTMLVHAWRKTKQI